MPCFIIVLLFSSLLLNTNCLRYAHFTKTKCYFDDCDESSYLNRVNTVKRKVDCSLACSENDDCRKYLFCDISLIATPLCKLYLDGTDCRIRPGYEGCSCYKKNIGCNEGNCVCPWGYYGENCENIIQDCYQGIGVSNKFYLITTIKPLTAPEPFNVGCNVVSDGTGTTVILSRNNKCSFNDFNRSMEEYEKGLGLPFTNHWLGFDKIRHILQNPSSFQKLVVSISPVDAPNCVSIYYNISFGDKAAGYKFHADTYVTSSAIVACGDSMMGTIDLRGKNFSTFDHTGNNQCAKRFGGGWWFSNDVNCSRSFFTGTMDGSGTDLFWMDDLAGSTLRRAVFRLSKKL